MRRDGTVREGARAGSTDTTGATPDTTGMAGVAAGVGVADTVSMVGDAGSTTAGASTIAAACW